MDHDAMPYVSNAELLGAFTALELRKRNRPNEVRTEAEGLELEQLEVELYARSFAPKVDVRRMHSGTFVARVLFLDTPAVRSSVYARRRAEQVYRLAARCSTRYDVFALAAVCVEAMDGRLWLEGPDGTEAEANAYARWLHEVLADAIAAGEVIP